MTTTLRRPHPAVLVLLVLLGSALGTTVAATAQDRTARDRTARDRTSQDRTSQDRDRGAGRSESSAPRVRGEGGREDAEDAEVETSREVVEGRGKVKVIEFSGLDISGRLKSPQLLYFLNRLRAEFDRPRLPHRSFMPELQRATKSRSFE